jgi:hypothetical protein
MRVFQLEWISIGSLVLLIGASTACHHATEEEYDDVATHVGALSSQAPGGDSEAARDTAIAAKGGLPEGLTRMGMGTITGRRGQLTYSFELTCKDAMGQVEAACDSSTDSAHLVLHWTGDIATLRYKATLDRTGDWTMTGLRSETATFNGKGTFDVDSEFTAIYRPLQRTFEFDYDADYDGVQIRMSDRVLTGGKATYDIQAHRTTEWRSRQWDRTFEVHAEVTFDGTGTAKIALDGSRRYTVDLATGEVVRLTK